MDAGSGELIQCGLKSRCDLAAQRVMVEQELHPDCRLERARVLDLLSAAHELGQVPSLVTLAARVQEAHEQAAVARILLGRSSERVVQRAGEGLIVRADALAQTVDDLAQAPVANRDGLVIRVADVASVGIGQAPRLGAATQDGHEAVLGTALMIAGGNSRTVALAAAERLTEVNRSLPPGIVAEPVLDRSVIDEVVTVGLDDALGTARALAEREGILAGMSAGAAVWGALQVAARPEAAGQRIVVIVPDAGERYLSTTLYEDLREVAS